MSKEIENIEYFGNYLNPETIMDQKLFSTEWLADTLKEFRRMKSECIMDVNKIKGIMNSKRYKYKSITSNPAYTSKLGFLRAFMLGNFGVHYQREVSKDVLIPLAHLNEDYCKSKIHSRNLEICYINANIKTIQGELRRRKKEERNNEV